MKRNKKNKVNKKKILVLCIAIILIMGTSVFISATGVIPDEDAVEITFEDKFLFEAVKNYFTNKRLTHRTDEETLFIRFHKDAIETIKEFDFRGVDGAKITNLNGIEVFTNLQKLNLTNNTITDITPISRLTKLTSIDLSYNQNINIYNKETNECYLPNKTNIEELNISNTNNSDISFINKLVKLKILKASNNGISSTTELSTLANLEILDLSQNTAIVKIDDILPILSLKSLNISSTGITSLLHSKSEEGDEEYGIFVLGNLEELYVSNNTLTSINPITKYYLETVEEMWGEVEIRVPYLKKLEVLDFNYTNQNNINYENLILLENLTHLSMKGNRIEYISDQITQLNKLEYINLSDNLILNIDFFVRDEGISDDDCQKDAFGNVLYDENGKPKLKENPNVTYYEDEYGYTRKRTPLKAKKIELAHNRITNIGPLSYLNHDIEYLDLSENAVYNIDIIDSGRFSFKEGLKLQGQGCGWEEPIYYMFIKDKAVKVDQYIILPSLFQNSKKTGSKIYSSSATFTGTNLKINSDKDYQVPGYYNVIISHTKTESDILKVTLSGGCADGSVLHFKISSDDISIDSALFNDDKLVKAVAGEISAREGYSQNALRIINVYSYVFNSINKLDLVNKGITDITGLSSFNNLEYLYLSNNNISSIRDLQENNVMKELYLSNNKNLKNNNAAIENMVNLIKLDISNTGATDIKTISALIQNMHKNNEWEYPLKYLNLSGNLLGNIEGVEKTTSLEELYISNIGIKDISKLSKLTNLKTLNASVNKIENIEALRGLKKLKYLNISNNNIENIEPISKIALDELNFSTNRVKNVTSLTKSYTTLIMDSNFISDISIFDGMRIQNFSLANQKLTHTVEQGKTGDITIELPELLLLSKQTESKVYSSQDFILSNCQLTEDEKAVVVNVEALKNQIATVKINGGKANKTTFSIAEPLEGTITYNPSNEVPTNQNITASITFNRDNVTITNNDGKDTYVFTENGEFTFKYMDENGFEGVTTATVNNIDKIAPEGTVIQEIVNKQVVVKINLSEPVVEINGWDKSEEGLSITKTYSVDVNETITLTDNVGNSTSIQFVVEIDKTPPTITGVEHNKLYSQAVTPIIEDKNLDTIKLLKNETEVVNYTSGTVIIESGKYVLTAKDKFENETTVAFEIDVSGVLISLSDQVKITENESLGEEIKPFIRISKPKITVKQLRESISTEMQYGILNTHGEWMNDWDIVGTGFVIQMDGGKTYTIVVYGDINGDGGISISELAVASRIASNPETEIDKLKFMAMDVSKDGKIMVPDLAVLSRLSNTQEY